jgi:hypothetical protein
MICECVLTCFVIGMRLEYVEICHANIIESTCNSNINHYGTVDFLSEIMYLDCFNLFFTTTETVLVLQVTLRLSSPFVLHVFFVSVTLRTNLHFFLSCFVTDQIAGSCRNTEWDGLCEIAPPAAPPPAGEPRKFVSEDKRSS